jgi:hypothetical protein
MVVFIFVLRIDNYAVFNRYFILNNFF